MTNVQKSLAKMGLLLLLAAVAITSIVLGKRADEKETERKELEAKAFELDKAQVKKVVLTAKGETTELEKDGDGWKIVSPVQARADRFSVDPIVDKLADLKSREVAADDQSKAAEFGLDAPQFVVKAVLDGGKEVALTVGAENTFDQSLYFTKSGDARILVADSGLKWPLDKSLFDLRDKSLVTHEDKDVQSLEVTGGPLTFVVERDGEGWKLASPVQDRADKALVDSLLSRLRSARAKSFAEEQAPADLAKYGFDRPVAVATFAVGADKAKKTLQFGQKDEAGAKKTYARLVEGGPVMEVEDALVTELTKNLEDLRDKSVASFDREKVKRLEIAPAGGEKIVVTRTKEKKDGQTFESEKFEIAGRTEAPKTWKLSSALYTLSSLKGAKLVDENAADLKKYGLDAPKVSFAVFGDTDQEVARVLVGAETGTRYYAMASGSKRVYEVEKTTVDELPQKLDDVLEAPPASPADGGTAATPAVSGG